MSKSSLLLTLVCACTSTNTPGSVVGTIRNTQFVVADSMALTSATGVEIALASASGVCEGMVQHPGETALLLMLSDFDATTGRHRMPTSPGSYPIASSSTPSTAPRVADAEGNILDSMCLNNADNDTVADGGMVMLTDVGGGMFAGTFDLTFGSGDHVTGTFAASQCSSEPSTQPACQP